MSMKNFVFCLLVLFSGICGFSQEGKGHRYGKVTDSVSVGTSSNETYAIYLPLKYNPKTPTATVFIFEPGGRGKVGIAPFVSASEAYNYILICSNNSKNGLPEWNNEIAGRLFDHVLNNYNIDASQLYIAGFSGGSRLAGSIALNSGAFAGVIACGASFKPLDRFITPANSFSYVGLVGTRDMNYQEMIKNRVWLNKSGIRNELFISDAPHVWPGKNEILRAFDWLELQAYKKNIRKKNDSIVSKIFDKNLRIADSLSTEDAVAAVAEYERIRNDFDKKMTENLIGNAISTLKKSKAYKQQLKTQEEILVLEEATANEFSAKFDEELKSPKKAPDYNYWQKMVAKINAIDVKSKEEALKQLKYRLQYKLRAMVYEAGLEFKELKQNDKYLFCQKLQETIKID